MSVLGMLNNTATITRRTSTVGSTTGAPTATWASAGTFVCSIQADSSAEAQAQARETGRAQYKVYFPHGTDVRSTDRIEPATGSFAGRTFEVIGPSVDAAGRGQYTAVSAEEVEGAG